MTVIIQSKKSQTDTSGQVQNMKLKEPIARIADISRIKAKAHTYLGQTVLR